MTLRPGRLAGLLAIGLLLSSCASPTSPAAGSSELVSTRCADLVVLGARGSTQSPDGNLGVGTEVRVTVEALARRLSARSSTTVRVEPIRYDASATSSLDAYQANVAAGATMMVHQLGAVVAACPRSRVALIGFSQGAQVVHAASIDMSASRARSIALVAMIADPRHDPADDITQYGYAERPVTGSGRLGAGTAIDADLRAAAISLCVQGDEICNNRGAAGGPPSDTHRHFYEKPSSARVTATALDRVLRRNGI